MTEEEIPIKEEVREKSKYAPTPLDLFFKRVLHLSAYKILTMSNELELNDAVKEQLWEVMKK
jgi:hypothetical protein